MVMYVTESMKVKRIANDQHHFIQVHLLFKKNLNIYKGKEQIQERTGMPSEQIAINCHLTR